MGEGIIIIIVLRWLTRRRSIFTIRKVERQDNRCRPPDLNEWMMLLTIAPDHVVGSLSSEIDAGREYTLLPLEVRQHDIVQSGQDNSHVCQPVIPNYLPPPFILFNNVTTRYNITL